MQWEVPPHLYEQSLCLSSVHALFCSIEEREHLPFSLSSSLISFNMFSCGKYSQVIISHISKMTSREDSFQVSLESVGCGNCLIDRN